MRVETSRLVLRRWRSDDVEPLQTLLAEPEVAAWLAPPAPGEAEMSIRRYEHSWDTLGYGRFAVEDAETGALVGRVGLMHQEAWQATSDKVEVGWAITASRWGEGLATEAARAAIADGFRRVGLPRIVSFALPANVGSVRVMERCGMAFGGHAEWAGREHIWYALTVGARRAPE